MADEKNVIEIVLKAVDKATKPIQELNKSLEKTFAPAKKLGNQFAALEKATGISKISKAWGEVGSAVGNVKNQIVGTATTIIGSATVIGGALSYIAKGSIESADGLLTLSKETGVSVEGLQRLRFIASQTGSSAGDLDTAIKKFTVNMGMARAGQGNLYAIMSRVNPVMMRQMLTAKSTEDAFLLMLGAIQKLPKAQQQAALAQIAFGRGNLSLISTAKAGSAEYARLSTRIEQIGLTTKEQAEQANEAADAWSEFSLALSKARDIIVFQALPGIREIAKSLTQFLIDNKAAISQWGKEFAERLPDIMDGLVGALKAVATILGPLVALFAFLGRHTTLLNGAIAIMVELWTVKLVYGIYQVIKAMGLLSGVMTVTPFGWFIIALTAIVGLGAVIYTNWDAIVGTLKEAWIIIKNLTSAMWDMIKAAANLPGKILSHIGFSTSGSSEIPVSGAKQAPVSQNKSEASVKVSFDNLPKGARVSSASEQDILDLTMGYAMQ